MELYKAVFKISQPSFSPNLEKISLDLGFTEIKLFVGRDGNQV